MIQINSIHHNYHTSNRSTRSHILTPHDAVTLFLIIDGENESIISIIEDHLLETISSTEWNIRETNQDFSYITENYNTFSKSFSEKDVQEIRILIGMLQGENLTLTTIGDTLAIFVEKNGEILDISIHDEGAHEFHSITNGKIPTGSTIYLSSDNIVKLLGNEIIEELSTLPADDWCETGKGILSREVSSNLHMIRLSRRNTDTSSRPTREKKRQVDILRNHGVQVFEYLRSKKMWEKTKGILQKLPCLETKKSQYAFIATGMILLFTLSYILVSSILFVLSPKTSDTKNLLIQAKVLIDEGEKLTANKAAFNTKITEAENILFDLKKEQTHIADTQKLLSRISAMKKEVYDIQSIDITGLSSIVPFNPAEITPIGTLEKDNKLIIIGEQSTILSYVTKDKTIKTIPYPGGEKAKSFDIGEDGSIYILTQESHVLTPRRDELAYINVTGQNSWEDALSLKTFNGNIYLLDSVQKQIQKHKPGVNGFSQKSNSLGQEQTGIFDFSIDGGIYVFLNDGKILRYTGKPGLQSITLNKIPGEWSLDTKKQSTFITKSNLSFIYILNGDKIWIFQPDSKRFQDIKSWTYIGQFEIKSNSPIRHIHVPRDGKEGLIYITTKDGVYEVRFDFVDGKITFK